MNIVLNNTHIGPFINSLASSGGQYETQLTHDVVSTFIRRLRDVPDGIVRGMLRNSSFNQIGKIFYDIISLKTKTFQSNN